MLYLWYFRRFLLLSIFWLSNIQYVKATWPVLNVSSIQLLGLFPDVENTSEPTDLSVHSRAMFKAALVLSQQYNITINGQYIGGQVVQTGGNIMGALSKACRVMPTSKIIGITGPAYSREALIIAPFAESIGIPAISYSATNPELSDRNAYPAFHRTVPSDATAVSAIVKLFMRFNWTSCILIYQNDQFGSGAAEMISDEFNNHNFVVSETIVFDIATGKIRGDLQRILFSASSRIVILWADNNYTSSILQYALDGGVVGPQFTWILSSTIPLNIFNKTSYSNLIGMLSVESASGASINAPVNTSLLNAAYNIWQQYELETFPGSTNVNDYALFSFDATWILIQSLQRLCSLNTNKSSLCVSIINSSFCFDHRFLNTSLLFDTINTMEFVGVSGPIKFATNSTDRRDGVYYLMQNVQPSVNGIDFVPVLQWSYSNDWTTYTKANTIVWPGYTLISPTGFAGLSGIELRICVIEAMPFTMTKYLLNQNTTSLIGYIPDLIDILQSKMGFIPNIILPQANQTYDGLIQAVANGVCDLAIGDITVTSTRREIVDFSNSIFDNSLRIIVRQQNSDSVDLFSYLRPFTVDLWLAVLGGSVCAAILLCLIERKENEALKDRSMISSIGMSMWYSFGNLVGYGVDFNVQTAAGRVITAGLYVLSLILVATYTANLASDLTISKSKDVISGIDDIKNGKIPFGRIGIITGSSIEDYYVREISQGSRNFYPLKSHEDLFNKLLNGAIDASIWDIGLLEYATNNIYCNLTLVGTDFCRSTFGIVMPKQWIYGKDLDIAVLSLSESGALDDLKVKWFGGSVCQESTSSVGSTGIKIITMTGLFLTYGIIIIIALLLFLWTKRFVIKDHLMIRLSKKSSTIYL